jgi:hypothetical protein
MIMYYTERFPGEAGNRPKHKGGPFASIPRQLSSDFGRLSPNWKRANGIKYLNSPVMMKPIIEGLTSLKELAAFRRLAEDRDKWHTLVIQITELDFAYWRAHMGNTLGKKKAKADGVPYVNGDPGAEDDEEVRRRMQADPEIFRGLRAGGRHRSDRTRVLPRGLQNAGEYIPREVREAAMLARGYVRNGDLWFHPASVPGAVLNPAAAVFVPAVLAPAAAAALVAPTAPARGQDPATGAPLKTLFLQ